MTPYRMPPHVLEATRESHRVVPCPDCGGQAWAARELHRGLVNGGCFGCGGGFMAPPEALVYAPGFDPEVEEA